MSGRLTVRFSPAYVRWIAALGGDQAEAVRALMTLGAAALGLPEAEYEAHGLLRSDLPPFVKDALMGMADKRQTSGRQAADVLLQPVEPLDELPGEPADEPEVDPFVAAGIEV
jgi:hypothetical protein